MEVHAPLKYDHFCEFRDTGSTRECRLCDSIHSSSKQSLMPAGARAQGCFWGSPISWSVTEGYEAPVCRVDTKSLTPGLMPQGAPVS